MHHFRTAVLSALVLASAVFGQDLLIRNARILPVKGAEIPKGDLLVRAGRIVAVGTSLVAPADVAVLDAAGSVAVPAFVLAHTTFGTDTPNEVVPVTPYVSVLDSIDPTTPFFEDCLRDGNYTLNVMPGDQTVIGGMGRIVRPRGVTVEEMTIVPEPGLKISMIPTGGVNRAAHLGKLRQALEEGRNYLEKRERDAKDAPKPTGNVVFDLESLQVERRKMALSRLLKREYPAYIACGTAGDVAQALQLAEEFGLDVRLYCLPGTWRAAKLLAEKKIPVILHADFEIEEKDPETGKEVERIVPRIFRDAGVRFAVTNQPGSLGRRFLWYQAACLVRYGFPRDEALASITSVPAEILGLAGKKGVLAEGADGDILLLTDDPFSGRAWVDKGLMGGRVVYDRFKDPRLAEVFGTESR